MSQSRTLSVGMDVHKESIAVASVAQAHGAEVVSLGGVGYVDNVATLPHFRRRGIAAAVVDRMVREARTAGAEHVCLLADEPGPIRLYGRLGFDVTGRLVSSFGPVER